MMKLKIQIDSQIYEVEIDDLDARPIRARVDGEDFEVWPEGESQPAATPQPTAASQAKTPTPASTLRPAPAASASPDVVSAPIPGVIISIAVQAGASVTRGQELCMLEAMKMNNAIRSPRDGKIANVPVNVGQAVKHGDVLVTFEP